MSDPSPTLTVLDILNRGTGFLEKKGVEDARRNMQLMTAHVLGCNRMQLYLDFDKPLVDAHRDELREMIKRRAEKQPLQYVLGETEFYKRSFFCDARGLIPRPETEELVEMILPKLFGNKLNILDVGTGSGVLGLSLALELASRCESVTLADISKDALALAEKNAQRHELEAAFIESDLLQSVSVQPFQLIAANLPYIAEKERENLTAEVLHEPHNALFSGEDGLDLLRVFIPAARAYLAPGGLLALEIGYDQAEAVAGLLEASGYTDVTVETDLSGIARFPFARNPSK